MHRVAQRSGWRLVSAASTASFYLLPGHEPLVSASDSPRCEMLLARALGLRAKHSAGSRTRCGGDVPPTTSRCWARTAWRARAGAREPRKHPPPAGAREPRRALRHSRSVRRPPVQGLDRASTISHPPTLRLQKMRARRDAVGVDRDWGAIGRDLLEAPDAVLRKREWSQRCTPPSQQPTPSSNGGNTGQTLLQPSKLVARRAGRAAGGWEAGGRTAR